MSIKKLKGTPSWMDIKNAHGGRYLLKICHTKLDKRRTPRRLIAPKLTVPNYKQEAPKSEGTIHRQATRDNKPATNGDPQRRPIWR